MVMNSAQIIRSATKYDQQKTSLILQIRTRRAVTKPLNHLWSPATTHCSRTQLCLVRRPPRPERIAPSPPVTAHASQPQRTRLCIGQNKTSNRRPVGLCPTTTYEHVTFKVNQTAGMITLQPLKFLNANSSL